MDKSTTFDWNTQLKEISVRDWTSSYIAVEEPHISKDGETIASIVQTQDNMFTVCANGTLWDNTYEKTWSLTDLPDGKFAACVCTDEEWTLCIDGKEWENWFDFIWHLSVSKDGSSIGIAVQKDMEYGMAVNDIQWPNMYENICEMVLSDTGSSAAVIQAAPMAGADVEGFKKGIFSCAVNGNAFEQLFLNIWDISFDDQGKNVAYGVRLNRTDYTIAKNNSAWEGRFQSVWKPVFLPGSDSVIAPVFEKGKWRLFKDGTPFWNKAYTQLWHLTASAADGKVAAIVSTDYGKWTVAQDDVCWDMKVDQMISDIFYSQDGSTLVAVVKHNGFWSVAVNGKMWALKADKVFNPVISPDGTIVSVPVEQNGKYFLIVNDKAVIGPCDYVAEPVLHPDLSKILSKAVTDDVYQRQVLSLDAVM